MRIVTRPDFDGIVCAVLIVEAETIDEPTLWIEPGQVQNGSAEIRTGDIMANLPYDDRCSLWFDHHVSNALDRPFQGAFNIAPSAAGVVYDYYKSRGKLSGGRFDELVRETDIIDAAKLTKHQVLYPEEYPYIFLSMTVKNHDDLDPPYWDRLVSLLRTTSIQEILNDPEVKARCRQVIRENHAYVEILKANTQVHGKITVADFREMDQVPSGNRFLTYSLFPESRASIKIRYADGNRDTVIVSIGHSIFTPGCRVNVGRLLARFGGGGHRGAGGCSLPVDTAEDSIKAILHVMKENSDC